MFFKKYRTSFIFSPKKPKKTTHFLQKEGFEMKRIVMFLLTATIVADFSGCSIYQGYLSYKLDEELSRGRARERQKVALEEIGKGTEVLSRDGSLLGGFPVIFINDSRETVRIFVTKLESSFRGRSWYFLVPAEGIIESKLETGNYNIQWTTQGYYYSNNLYPRIPDKFSVTCDSHLFYDQTGREYHGGYQILRNY